MSETHSLSILISDIYIENIFIKIYTKRRLTKQRIIIEFTTNKINEVKRIWCESPQSYLFKSSILPLGQ